ncbi:hypothetical protein BD311DRAFT_667592 [Dichomitus squalens]|uniref:Uncharacterized protein n=1 Tax=Dichomitus squalens TaxID=114155 RepID=A0A4Q9MJM3_9APHY|nr:hypothetical protein BD311DRAFT_667592 [Dichomitus squalens]
MPLNTTISHVSPLLSYIPRTSWYEGNSSDPELNRYSNQSYHYSDSPASVTFSWWGTGAVFGGYRNRTGAYQVVVDSQAATSFPGYTGGPDEFERVLYANDGLSYGQHQIRITNTGGGGPQSVLDIDYLVYETTQDDGGEIQHNDPGCSWSPASPNTWQVDAASHTTTDTFGAMELNFTVSSGIILYGYLDGTSAPLTVSVNGWASTPVAPNTAIAPIVHNVPQVLYTKSGLQNGPHTLRVENNPLGINGTGSKMSIAFSRTLSDAPAGSAPQQETP